MSTLSERLAVWQDRTRPGQIFCLSSILSATLNRAALDCKISTPQQALVVVAVHDQRHKPNRHSRTSPSWVARVIPATFSEWLAALVAGL